MGAGKQTQVLWKRSKRSQQLSHLISPIGPHFRCYKANIWRAAMEGKLWVLQVHGWTPQAEACRLEHGDAHVTNGKYYECSISGEYDEGSGWASWMRSQSAAETADPQRLCFVTDSSWSCAPKSNIHREGTEVQTVVNLQINTVVKAVTSFLIWNISFKSNETVQKTLLALFSFRGLAFFVIYFGFSVIYLFRDKVSSS